MESSVLLSLSASCSYCLKETKKCYDHPASQCMCMHNTGSSISTLDSYRIILLVSKMTLCSVLTYIVVNMQCHQCMAVFK